MKKLWVNIMIFFGCFLLLVTSLGAVLIIAPGMELLGIMYIRHTSGNVEITDAVSNPLDYKTIEIVSDNIPVTIEFVQSYFLSATLVENYDGFAKAGSAPTVQLSQNGETLFVTSSEYKPFLGYSRGEGSGLFVKIPMYYTSNIVVNSNKSNVKFAGQKSVLNDITINAKGAIEFGSDITMHSLVLNFGNKNAVISNSVNLSGTITATSNRGNLTLPEGFTGALDFTSSTGNLYAKECGQLSFKSTTGRVRGIDNVLPVINGDAKIETNGSVEIERIAGAGIISTSNGKVTLGSTDSVYENRLDIKTKFGKVILNGVYKNAESVISTKYGKISIDNGVNMGVTSSYGDVNIKTAENVKVATKSGDVTIQNIVGTVEITTKGGDVTLGGDECSLGNANITTKGGDVSINNAQNGEFNVTTKSGDVNFNQNKDYKAKTTIVSTKGKVNLSNITGETCVETKGKVTAHIIEVNKPVTIKGKNKNVEVTLDNLCQLNLSSKKKIESAPDMLEKAKTFSTVTNENAEDILTISTKRGKISVTI